MKSEVYEGRLQETKMLFGWVRCDNDNVPMSAHLDPSCLLRQDVPPGIGRLCLRWYP